MRAAQYSHTLVFAILILLVTGSIVVAQSRQGVPPTIEDARRLPPPDATPKRPVGIQAVSVRPGASPPFLAEDILNYLKSHRLPKISISSDQLVINSLDFITNAEASKRLRGAATGLSDNELVGFTTFSGRLATSGPPGGKNAVSDRGYAVFDAGTGNLLMIGTF
jgi:hypothetical protein